MRGRRDSGLRLDYYHRVALEIIMCHQDPVTGLFPASPSVNHAWVRDNVYTILAVWGLSMAYKKMADLDEDRAKTYELEQSCVKMMRGLLMCMMRQKDKVELFKMSQNPSDSLHAKYSARTGRTVVGDSEWGHLQIDAVSLYLLTLAQMTASGIQIIFNHDEVAFIQNLVFYIESAYCIPDYGIWERGDKANHGLLELNASSIGMAKAALEAMNELDLFGARGGPTSVIHVLADEAQKCQAVLQSMLPRESSSKEIDSGLLSVISFPAFAVDDPKLIELTKGAIVTKLKGNHGFKRFLRDGYRTPREDPNRLHYEPSELRMFENIECEWPLFFCYLWIDAFFQNDEHLISYYEKALEKVVITNSDGVQLVPEMYSVDGGSAAEEEAKKPGSQPRHPVGRSPFLWAQSLYLLGKLIKDGYLAAAELDPLNRRLCSEKKPDVVVQVVILAENNEIREILKSHDIEVQTVNEVAPLQVLPARVLSHLYTYLGKNRKLKMSGRKSRDVGILSTSKLYSLQDKLFAFTPQSTDVEEFYMRSDVALLSSDIKTDLSFLALHWSNLGRPIYLVVASTAFLEDGKIPLAMITTMKKLKSGYINGTRVSLGKLNDFLTTSCITNLSFLGCQEDGAPELLKREVGEYLREVTGRWQSPRVGIIGQPGNQRSHRAQRKISVKGAIKRTRSIISSYPVENISGGVSEAAESGGGSSPEPCHLTEPEPSKQAKLQPHVRHRNASETQYANTEVEELLTMLKESNHLEEQGDILQHLIGIHGLSMDTGMRDESGGAVTLKELLKEVYNKACQQKLWGLVRHTAGTLGKRVEDLAKSVTDLLVRQKQVTVGMPSVNEHTITAPLPENELRQLIHQAYGDDESTAMLTQELLVYLAMFIRTEPQLFSEMLRLRVGLIIQVMAGELCRTLNCSEDEASEHLLNLSPYEMKNLLHHIISGREFVISSVGQGNFSIVSLKSGKLSKKSDIMVTEVVPGYESEKGRGQWLRRRRLDGALNRVPGDLYSRIWHVLEKCEGLIIEGHLLHQNLTKEMTSGELKFALAVESGLNTIPQPEYRQLVVETLMVLTLFTEYKVVQSLGGIIVVDNLVHKANEIFLQDQVAAGGDSLLCCAQQEESSSLRNVCSGAAYICQHFYDSAPSGTYGTMTYIMRAVLQLLDCYPAHGTIDCNMC